MSIQLRNASGSELQHSNGHWAVYLTLAEAFGWRPAGTAPPPLLASGVKWSGRYDSSDGQSVTEPDAKVLAQTLHAALVSPKIGDALFDVIAHIERQIQGTGMQIPQAMRMHPNDFSKEMSLLVMFLYEGPFTIE